MGVLSAGPVADGLAFILAVVLLVKETRSLKEGDSTEEKISNIKTIEEKNTSTPVIITIAREYGSGGRYIGKLVAEKLGIKLYDKNIYYKLIQSRISNFPCFYSGVLKKSFGLVELCNCLFYLRTRQGIPSFRSHISSSTFSTVTTRRSGVGVNSTTKMIIVSLEPQGS